MLQLADDGICPLCSATGMLKTWFNSAGWPRDMAKSDHRGFAHAILRQKDDALRDMLRGGEVPLRDGAHLHSCTSSSASRMWPLTDAC